MRAFILFGVVVMNPQSGLRINDIPLLEDLPDPQRKEILGRSSFSIHQETSMSSLDQLVNKANDSAEFRRQLIASPEAAAKSVGIAIPAGAKLIVHQDTANEMN